ncbi:uncharacterized protein [Gossypium hirsutum]|uniref:Uncharacterized protein isoform X3 n=1 Tax=Gossypium hirsutum TaxID=3635 RepID=A0ABM3AL83_GOSHI|nr:uncharacterized protein LOC107915356 isoform X3 [Gossypium hirsutum]
MHLSAAINSFKSSNRISWKTTGKLQQTLAGCIELSGKTRQSGKVSKTDTRFRPSSICFRLWKLKASTIVEFRFKVSILRILRSRGNRTSWQKRGLGSGLWDVENDNDGQQEGCVLRVISQF